MLNKLWPFKSQTKSITKDLKGSWTTLRDRTQRGITPGRLDSDWSDQPWGASGTRVNSPEKRRKAVRRSRHIYRTNPVGFSLIERDLDNTIGEGMMLSPMTGDDVLNREIEAAWAEDSVDSRGFEDNQSIQRVMYRALRRDGDVGAQLLLTNGKVRVVESDYIQTPAGPSDLVGDEVYDGVKLDSLGRPTTFYLASTKNNQPDYSAVRSSRFAYMKDNDRQDYTAVRGVPALSEMGELLDQISGTMTSVTIAYRMACMFGLLRRTEDPGGMASAVRGGTLTTDSEGNSKPEILLDPGRINFLGLNEKVEQVKPEHPSANLADFMRLNIRFAGLRFSMPLELVFMDFSQTNYSSARASMEQAYRAFSIKRRQFARFMQKIYWHWMMYKIDREGQFGGGFAGIRGDNRFRHVWMGQPWPYLDPQKEAEAALVAIDGGLSTLTAELAKRNMTPREFVEVKLKEKEIFDSAGMNIDDLRHSRRTEPGEEPNEDTDTNR